jgi:carboxymethylenebutenolidase
VEDEIRVRTTDGEMTVFVVHPNGDGPYPVAVLYMDGVGDREQVKENARRFAADGYDCVAPDLFYRSGEKLSFDLAQMGRRGGSANG